MISKISSLRILIFASVFKKLFAQTLREESHSEESHKIPFGSIQFYLYICYSLGMLKNDSVFRGTNVRIDCRLHFNRPTFTQNETRKRNPRRKKRIRNHFDNSWKPSFTSLDFITIQLTRYGVTSNIFRRDNARVTCYNPFHDNSFDFWRSTSSSSMSRTQPNQNSIKNGSNSKNIDFYALDYMLSNISRTGLHFRSSFRKNHLREKRPESTYSTTKKWD